MHLRKFKLFLFCTLSLQVFANNTILSPLNENIFILQKKQNEENKNKLKKDWLNPVLYKYIQNYNDTLDTKKSMLSISQAIFKSGGIFQAIKYANNLNTFNEISIEIQRKNLIKDATSMLFSLKKFDLSIYKQKILIQNALIDINRKKEQVLNGFLDTSFLNNAILEANRVKTALLELEFQKTQLVNNFSNLSNKKYTQLKEPELELFDEKNFLSNNLELKKSLADIKTQKNYQQITLAKYLPSVNVFYDYTKYHDKDSSTSLKDGDTYGFNITIPLDIKAVNDYEKEKILSKLKEENLELLKLKQKTLYKNILLEIKMIQEKSILAKEDYSLYETLLKVIIEEKDAQIKTQSDVDTLKNSQKIKALDIQIFKYDEQILLLELYAKIK